MRFPELLSRKPVSPWRLTALSALLGSGLAIAIRTTDGVNVGHVAVAVAGVVVASLLTGVHATVQAQSFRVAPPYVVPALVLWGVLAAAATWLGGQVGGVPPRAMVMDPALPPALQRAHLAVSKLKGAMLDFKNSKGRWPVSLLEVPGYLELPAEYRLEYYRSPGVPKEFGNHVSHGALLVVNLRGRRFSVRLCGWDVWETVDGGITVYMMGGIVHYGAVSHCH